MLYIQALELVSKEVAINLLEHLIMLYIQAGSKKWLVSLIMLYKLQSWLAKKWQSTCWNTSVCYIQVRAG